MELFFDILFALALTYIRPGAELFTLHHLTGAV
jgi:hypothetical protein